MRAIETECPWIVLPAINQKANSSSWRNFEETRVKSLVRTSCAAVHKSSSRVHQNLCDTSIRPPLLNVVRKYTHPNYTTVVLFDCPRSGGRRDD